MSIQANLKQRLCQCSEDYTCNSFSQDLYEYALLMGRQANWLLPSSSVRHGPCMHDFLARLYKVGTRRESSRGRLCVELEPPRISSNSGEWAIFPIALRESKSAYVPALRDPLSSAKRVYNVRTRSVLATHSSRSVAQRDSPVRSAGSSSPLALKLLRLPQCISDIYFSWLSWERFPSLYCSAPCVHYGWSF
jgi:hypothetical protein